MVKAPRSRTLKRGEATDAQKAEVSGLLRSYGLRSTAQRLAILNAIGSAGHGPASDPSSHLTVADIHDRLSESDNHIDLSTIYRAVTTLVNLGVLHAIAHKDQPVTYGLAAHAHHHAVCTKCGAVSDIPADRLAPMIETVREISDFRAQDVRITVHGRCADCVSS